jgi:two-component system chemotaxis response regulator CheB
MSLRVSLAASSAFLSMVIRQTLSPIRDLALMQEDRDAAAALCTLQQRPDLAIIDAALFAGAAGADLIRQVAVRHEPTIVVDSRAGGIPEGLTMNPSVCVVSGRQAGEFDPGSVESDLREMIGKVRRFDYGARVRPLLAPVPRLVQRNAPYTGRLDLVVLGVSTGGPTLLTAMLKDLHTPTLPMLIVQHMPESETAGYAARLAQESGHVVIEVAHGTVPGDGTISVVRGGRDFRLIRSPAGHAHLRNAELPGNPFHPNVDEILVSAVAAGLAVGAAILTGMGSDGTVGAIALAEKGYPVLAQRPDTCAVAGMPQSVAECGAASAVQTPEGILTTINKWFARAADGKSMVTGK